MNDGGRVIGDNKLTIRSMSGKTETVCRPDLLPEYHRMLLDEAERLRESNRSHEDQLVWLADWCRSGLGVEPNGVIGKDGWPRTVAEVVARAAGEKIDRLRQALLPFARIADAIAADGEDAWAVAGYVSAAVRDIRRAKEALQP